jgi:hypothetical protein
MLKSTLLVLTLLVQSSTGLMAQETPRPNNVRNAGAFLCSAFLPVVRQPGREVEKTAFLNWAAAYTTAASRSNGMIDMFPIGDTWELLRTISLVCVEDETQSFEKALQVTLSRMRPFWVRQDSGVISLSDPSGRTIQFFTEAVPALQEALNQYGANVSIDGEYGNQTGNAILRINQARGAQGWMTPDGELLYQITRPEN